MAKKQKKRFAKKPKKQPFLLWALKWLFLLGFWGGLAVGALVLWYARDLPDIAQAPQFDRRSSITILGADGGVLTRYGGVKGESIGVEDLPSHLIYAIISTEDRRFYQHFGIDPMGIARAMGRNILAGRVAQGGSTITQQLAKNLFLSQERTIKRKVQEAMLAIWLERELTKDEILSAYLNRVYLGSGAYGVEAASQLYFNKSAIDVSLRESSLLAGLLKAPSRYSPLRNPDLAMRRANVVLDVMADAGYISQAHADSLKNVPPAATRRNIGNSIRYFGDYIIDRLEALIGTPPDDIIIETTLQPGLQILAQQEVNRIIDGPGAERQISQGAALVMRPDGAILAMVGGRNFSQSQFNRAVQAQRAPGSAFKPVIYLAALEQGKAPDSLVLDAPFTEGEYRPENYGGEYEGPVTYKEALTLSLNTAAVRVMQDVGPGRVVTTAKRLGISSPLERDLSLALGSSGVSLLEMTSVYGTFASGGRKTEPYAITSVYSRDGELYYERSRWRSNPRVIERRDVAALDDMLKEVVRTGTGQSAASGLYSAAGKTGTSQESRDAWFIGYTDKIVAGIWLGNDDNSPMSGVTGGSYPASIWRAVARAAHSGNYGQELETPAPDDNEGLRGLLDRLLGSGQDEPSNADARPTAPRYND